MNVTVSPKMELELAPYESWQVKTCKRLLTEGGTKRRIPLLPATDCLFARWAHGLLWVRFAYTRSRPGRLVLDCAEGKRLIAITVAHGKAVCLNVGRVVAMSNTIRLRSCVSFSLAAASASHIFVKQAYCPRPETSGTIVLETAGEPTCASGQNATFDVSRMIAWDPEVEFRTTRLETLACMFIEPVCVSASADDEAAALLLEADAASGAFSPWKAVRRALSLVIPGF